KEHEAESFVLFFCSWEVGILPGRWRRPAHRLWKVVSAAAGGGETLRGGPWAGRLQCWYPIRTACVLSSRRICAGRSESKLFGSTIFSPSSWTLPCLIRRPASVRDLVV